MIKGPVFPVITAFKKNGDVDYQSTLDYIDFLCNREAKTIYFMAHSSRMNLLTPNEIINLNKDIGNHIKRNWPDVIFIGATPPYGDINLAIKTAKAAEQAGADVISVLFTERYYSDEQIVKFFETISKNISCGILIHGDKLNTIYGTKKVNYPYTLLDKLYSIENIISIKEDTKEDDYTAKIVANYPNIIVSGGSKEQFIQFESSAYLVGIASIWPKIASKFYAAYKIRDWEVCWALIRDYERPFFKVTKRIGWHIALKAAMEIENIMKRYERLPLMEVKNEEYEEIKTLIRGLK